MCGDEGCFGEGRSSICPIRGYERQGLGVRVLSGPKCTTWSVAKNLRLAALARQAAWDSAASLEADLAVAKRALDEALAQTCGSISATRPPLATRPNSDESTDAIDRYIIQLRALLSYARSEASQVIASAQLGEILARIVSTQNELGTRNGGAAHQTTEAILKKREADVLRIVSRLPITAGQAERAIVEKKAEAMLAAITPAKAEMLEMELRAAVQIARDGQQKRTVGIARSETLIASLRGLTGAAVDQAMGRLEAVVLGVGDIDEFFEVEVAEIACEAKAKADRDYAADVLREEFEALGYDVGEDFQTAFVAGGTVSFQRADRSPYSVQVAFDPHAGNMDTEVVRHGLSDSSEIESEREDLAAEEAWCDDLSVALTGARKRSVIAQVVRDTPPGMRRVATVGEISQQAARSRTRRPTARTL